MSTFWHLVLVTFVRLRVQFSSEWCTASRQSEWRDFQAPLSFHRWPALGAVANPTDARPAVILRRPRSRRDAAIGAAGSKVKAG